MDDYISKPIDENLLYSKIVELVKRNHNGGSLKCGANFPFKTLN